MNPEPAGGFWPSALPGLGAAAARFASSCRLLFGEVTGLYREGIGLIWPIWATSILTPTGFGDPPKFDATLGALVYGNGRTEALERMRAEGKAPPRGIAALEDGQWAIPVIFGVDAVSRAAAVAFAIDHNNLTLLGGDLGFTDLLAIWDEAGLQKVLTEVPDAGALLASLDAGDVAALLIGPDFKPAGADEQSRLDEKKLVTCPECGHEFRPKK